MRPPETESIPRFPLRSGFAHQGSFLTLPRGAWFLLGLIALLYVGVSFAPVIFDDNEGLYAGAVREMHARHDWLVPMSNGFPRVQKPPLVYWLMLLSTSLLGENEFALRLPNALATVGWIVATYLIMRRIGGERFGLASAAALASMLGVWIFNHLVQPEPFLACFVALSFWCMVEARFGERPAPRWSWLCWIFLGLGTMSKGLHGALWPLGSLMLVTLCVPRCRSWLRPFLSLRGIMLFALITVPWYAYMAARFPHFLSAHFLNEQLGAALDTRYPADARQLPLIQFYAQHLLFWLPWTLLLPGVIWACARRAPVDGSLMWREAEIDCALLMTCFAVLVLLSVAFSTRQDYYSMCCWGAAAGLLVFPWTARQMSGTAVPRWFLAGPGLFLALIGIGALILGMAVRPQTSGNALAAPIAQRDNFMDALSGISPDLWGHLLILLCFFGGAFAVGGGLAALAARRGQNFAAVLILAAMMAVPVILATRGFVVMSPYFSLAESARALNVELAGRPDARVACEGAPNTASSLIYYLNTRVHWVNAPFNNQYAQNVLDLGRGYYWNETALEAAWRSSQPVYLIVEDERLAYWRAQLVPAPRLWRHDGTRNVLVNR